MKILLATDGSDYSEGAARFLANFDLTLNDEITVLHVITGIPSIGNEESYYDGLSQIKQEVGVKVLDSVIDIMGPIKAKTAVALLEGYPDKIIVDTAAEQDIDLAVMGARGLTGLKSVLIGSVTRAVAINSGKPVLIVKSPQRRVPGRLKILFATDGSAYAAATARFLSSMPFPQDTEITIMNVIASPVSDLPERFVLEMNDRVKAMVAQARTAEFTAAEGIIAEARRQLLGKFTRIDVLIKVGDPSIETLHAADSLNADIIAVGCRGLRGIKGMLGSVSRYIINHSPCSVLVGKILKTGL